MAEKFGGIEGRRRGGCVSQLRRKQYPLYYIELGCNVAKTSLIPNRSRCLSEIIGSILGDGGLTSNQLHITLNSEKDADYCIYLRKLLRHVFKLDVGYFKRKGVKAVVLTVSGINFVNNLKVLGLKTGNKVTQQVSVPPWIINSPSYSRWCLRGLMDTDGGIFKNKYTINGRDYAYQKICFTNKSKPLIKFVFDTLTNNNFHPKQYKGDKVWLCSCKEVQKYLKIVGSSNYRLNKWFE